MTLTFHPFLPECFLGVESYIEEELGDQLYANHGQLFRVRRLK